LRDDHEAWWSDCPMFSANKFKDTARPPHAANRARDSSWLAMSSLALLTTGTRSAFGGSDSATVALRDFGCGRKCAIARP
jgi:hypothetical protein